MSKAEVRHVVSVHPTRERIQQYGRLQQDGLWRFTSEALNRMTEDLIAGQDVAVLNGVAALDNLGKVNVWWDGLGDTLIEFLEDGHDH